jgi:hypothetical protein
MAHGNRAAAEAFILSMLKEISPKGETPSYYKKRFESMSDAEFDAFMKRLETGEEFLVVITPNFSDDGLSAERNIEIAKKLGHDFFERLWIGPKGDTPAYLSPVKYLVLDLPLRRASQLLRKKIRLPEHNRSVDTMSGQPTGDSKGSKISFPELQILAAMGLDNCIVEMMKYRGGDLKGFNAMNGMIGRYGEASLKTLSNYASGVESTRTLKTFLTGMHLNSTL